jgi:hypothetical protein
LAITRRSKIGEVAVIAGAALREAGFDAVLTGGACASILSGGAYVSHDLDFVIRSGSGQAALDRALASIGFVRQRDRYVHSRSRFFVEFPRGPLSIGDDTHIRPVRLALGGSTLAALSPTDSCRDRLAAFYNWGDRQSLRAAAEIALRQRVNMTMIRRWSGREGASDKFEEFRRELARLRRRRRAPSRSR